MNIRIFHGFSDAYPEKISGTDRWLYSQITPCSEAYEVEDYKGKYPGTVLYIFDKATRQVYEPISQEKNVFLEIPVYDETSNSLAIIRYDFNVKIIQVIEYKPLSSEINILVEFSFAEIGNLENLRIIASPFTLTRSDVHNDFLKLIWPVEKNIQLEENELVDFIDEDKIYLSRWIEDPDYREVVIIRDLHTGDIIERHNGYLVKMGNNSAWLMTN